MIFVKLRLILNDTSFIITVFTLLFPHKSDIQDYICNFTGNLFLSHLLLPFFQKTIFFMGLCVCNEIMLALLS